MRFVDTNIFIRFLTKDDPVKAKACFKLFREAEKGGLELQTTESIIAEIVYILESKRLYNLSRSEIAKCLFPVIRIRKLRIPYKITMISALEIYSRENIDFEDAVLVSHALRTGSKEIYSYDKGIDKIMTIKRLEP